MSAPTTTDQASAVELSDTPAPEPGRRRIFHGWKVVGAGSVIQVLHSGLIMQAFGAYAVLLERQFGWSKTVISAAYSFNRAESGLLGPIQGWLLVRFGSRRVMEVGAVILCAGFLLFSRVNTPATFIAAFAVIAVGAGLSGFLTLTTETVKWFERHRAKALSLTMMGFAVGGLVTPGVVWFMNTYGWRTAAATSGVVSLLVIVPLARLFGHSPTSLRQPVDGIDPDAAPDPRPRAEGVSDRHFTLAEALRTRAFWMLAFGHAFALLVVGSVIAHLSLFLTAEHGFSLQQASYVVAGLTAFQLVGMLTGGVLGDRMSKRLLCSLAMIGHMCGLLLVTYWGGAWPAVAAFVVLHGMGWGIRGPLMGALRADYFGSTSFGQIMGVSSLILMFGMVGGPLLAGILADVTGSYQLGFTVLALLAGTGMLFFALASPPPRTAVRRHRTGHHRSGGADRVGQASTSSRALTRVFQDRVAHLMRTGNFTTPRSASRSPSFVPGSASGSSTSSGSPSESSSASWIDIIALNALTSSRASDTDLPFTAADIIEADDWLIEQP